MKVILLEDVTKIGMRYEIKDVSNGYAANYLIPNKLAEFATSQKIKISKQKKQQYEKELNLKKESLLKNIKALNNESIEIKDKTNEKGYLFKGIHKEDIVKALYEQTGAEISPDVLVLKHPIKEVGEHKIDVKYEDKKTSFKLIVSAL